MEDKELAPGLDLKTFQGISEMLEKLLEKETIDDPHDMALLADSLVLIRIYLHNDNAVRDQIINYPFRVTDQILELMGYSPEEIIAITVFFRKNKHRLEKLERDIHEKIEKLASSAKE